MGAQGVSIPETINPANLAGWVREELLAIEHARRVAVGVGWDADDIPGLVRAALAEYELARCERGTCAHDRCAEVNAIVFADRPFATLAAKAGIAFRLDGKGQFRAGPGDKITDEWRFFIARNKDAIMAEIRDEK